jgi:hypothetical protein
MLYSKDEGGITNEVLRDSLLGIRQQFDLTMKDRGLMDMTIDTRLRSMMKEVVQDGGQMRSTSEVDHCPECGECLHD